MRHAEAEKIEGPIARDMDRPLTPYGRLQARTMAEELKRRGILPKVISSPFVRTVQTAEILCDVLGTGSLQCDDRLASKGSAPDLNGLLATYRNVDSLLLLGHQPDIGMLVDQVIGFELGFSPAAVAAFESKVPAGWRYRWTRRPEDILEKKPS